ncbi:hypothetical protein ACSISR_004261 [Klebsiella pneumoniae]|jgi:hypothetical protein|uniref:Uncharacterized protein n=5 Tax=Klebsiella TaxID=570 RepID=A0AAI9GSI3_KLEOX|nr:MULTISPECIES: hypothetical protein [Klebsiella/Raoultella group]DAY50673.1 MAG TPA: hypothetical protein [Caudoviricetes sp.]HBR0797591.1 hypothetical protein [Klebsiella quasipneumoniae]HBR1505373.1 hypothetical protein [Klebsiella quasipneumoniae subsp. quasipneumoniae]HCI4642764.1 hypothetical protein [Klebsiella variicola subsp. variicola]HDT3401786.1 hypothetical protein [Klebsiella pneumoniae subsp. ozaenae]
MKTFNQIKSLIGFCQTDEFFLEYLQMLQAAGVIHPVESDIDSDSKTVSEDFYNRLASVYGIEAEETLWQQD